MNPGSGVSPTKGATSLLLLSLLQFTRGEAELAGEVNGNVGKCFHESLQREYWVFFWTRCNKKILFWSHELS